MTRLICSRQMGHFAIGSLAGLLRMVQVAQVWHMTRWLQSRKTVLISRLKQMLQSSNVSSSCFSKFVSSSTYFYSIITRLRRKALSSHFISVWLPLLIDCRDTKQKQRVNQKLQEFFTTSTEINLPSLKGQCAWFHSLRKKKGGISRPTAESHRCRGSQEVRCGISHWVEFRQSLPQRTLYC